MATLEVKHVEVMALDRKNSLCVQKNDVSHVVGPHQRMVNANVFMKNGTHFFMSANII
ncbi:MAG: hypothetical protein ACHQ03_07590 [Candidatus Bathyarchaeia archaeon]